MNTFAAAVSANGAAAARACALLSAAPLHHRARLLSVAEGALNDWRGHSIGALSKQLALTPLAAATALAETSAPDRGARPPRSPRHVAIVLTGRVTNLRPLQKHMSASGWVNADDDGAAVVSRLIEFHLRKGRRPLEAARSALQRLQGSFAFAATVAAGEASIYVAAKNADAFVGFTADAIYAISDRSLRPADSEITPLQSGDVATLRDDHIVITDADGMGIEKHAWRTKPPTPPHMTLVAP